jgi:PKD repeat protein
MNTLSFQNIQKIFNVLIIISFLCLGCGKEDKDGGKIAVSGFETQVVDPRFRKLVNSKVCKVDSNFYFRNLSTGGEGTTYHWNFGDGTESKIFTPRHIYKSSGKYIVKLTVTLPSGASESSEQELTAVAGQKTITLGPDVNTRVNDIVEIGDESLYVFGSSAPFNVVDATKTTLMISLDRDLREVFHKTFPIGYKFETASLTKDGNFIICGTTADFELNNELIKMDKSGTILWSKKINDSGNFTHILSITDGYLLTGTAKNQNGKWILNSVKTDLNGKVSWSKVYDKELIESSGNTISNGELFVSAGLKRADPNICSTCDSLSIIKFNSQGTVINKASILMKSTSYPISKVYLDNLNDGGIVIAASNAKGLYTFSSDLTPLLQTNVSSEITHINATATGEIVLLQKEPVNGFRVAYTGLDNHGATKWYYMIDGTQLLPDGYSCCPNSQGVKTYPLKKGGSVFIAEEIGDRAHFRIIVAKIDTKGSLM